MLSNALTHWRSTLFGALAGGLAAAALLPPNATWSQVALAFGTGLAMFAKGVVSADAQNAPKPSA